MPDSHSNSHHSAPTPTTLRLRVDKLCVAIQANSPAELIERAEAALADAKFLELRLDSLSHPAAALPKVKKLLAGHRDATVIATCRRKEFGGNFAQPLAAELEVLLAAAKAGCRIVDLEVESAEETTPEQLEQLRAELHSLGTALLVSFHDFSRTEATEVLDQVSRTHRSLPARFRQSGLNRAFAGRQSGRSAAH